MKDKIKNNLNNIKEVTDIRADYELMDIDYIDKEDERKTIIDADEFDVLYYIQHLQNEIERLNKQIEEYQKALDETTIDLEREKSQVKEYGTRLIKAIEYIEEQSKFIGGCDIYRICNKEVLLNILKGSDKE